MKKGAWACIPAERQAQRSDLLRPHLYRARNQVERFFNRSNNVVG